jgi:hypothetical protein
MYSWVSTQCFRHTRYISFGTVYLCGWIRMLNCFLQVWLQNKVSSLEPIVMECMMVGMCQDGSRAKLISTILSILRLHHLHTSHCIWGNLTLKWETEYYLDIQYRISFKRKQRTIVAREWHQSCYILRWSQVWFTARPVIFPSPKGKYLVSTLNQAMTASFCIIPIIH